MFKFDYITSGVRF